MTRSFEILSRANDVWNYVMGDNYNLDDLYDLKVVLLKDLESAQRELERVKSYERFGLPGFRWMVIHAQDEVDESFANLAVLETAIQDNKDRIESGDRLSE